MTYEPDCYWKAVRVSPPPLESSQKRIVANRKFIFFYSQSYVTLSPWRSGESCLSKDQRKTPLTCSTEVNQTPLYVEKSGSLESSGLKPNPD